MAVRWAGHGSCTLSWIDAALDNLILISSRHSSPEAHARLRLIKKWRKPASRAELMQLVRERVKQTGGIGVCVRACARARSTGLTPARAYELAGRQTRKMQTQDRGGPGEPVARTGNQTDCCPRDCLVSGA